MYIAAGACPDHAAQNHANAALAPNVPWLTLSQIMALVEKRLRWYGFDGFKIRDAVCNTRSTVTVMLRGPGRATLALTLGRDGAVHHVNLAQDPPAPPTPKPVLVHRSRSLRTRAVDALAPGLAPAASCV